MTTHEFYYPSSDGEHSIRAKEWLPAGEPRAVVQLSHGIAEHIGRYEPFAQFLSDNGIILAANDHLGHGRSVSSKEELGHFADIGGWLLVLEDMRTLTDMQVHLHPDIPFFMFGHSMGSFLLRCYASLHPEAEIAGYILSGTAHHSRFTSGAGALLCDAEIRREGPRGRSDRLYELCFGRFNRRFRGPTHVGWLSRDEAVTERYAGDPLCGFHATNAMYRDLFAMIRFMSERQSIEKTNKRTPVLLISGSEDAAGGYGRDVVKLYEILGKAGIEDLTYILYEGARHEILNELQKEDVMADVLEWIVKRI
ncbi:MAG: alpha/beta hydrolase [Clostridiales bacterium]|nr:alpha/beta hydrolase [Clostridiales bacterium]